MNFLIANPAGAFMQGQRYAAQADEMKRTRDYNNVLSEHGAGIAAGDPTALNALAQYDPMAVYLMQRQKQQDVRADEMLGFARDKAKREADAWAKSVSAEEAAAASAKVQSILEAGTILYQQGDRDGYNRYLHQNGMDPVEYPFEDLPMNLSKLKGYAEGFAPFVVQPYKPQSPAGKLAADLEAGAISQEHFDEASKKGPQTQIEVNTGEGDKFYETLDKKQADMFGSLLDQGVNVGAKIALVDELERGIMAAPEGAGAVITSYLGSWGIQTEGLSNLQAVEAIISRLVPEQRQPGSGPMSDADLELFKKSLPRLINTREGNLTIVRTLRGIAEYQAKQSEIAADVADRAITPAEGRARLRKLSNPLITFRGSNSPAPTVDIGGTSVPRGGPTAGDVEGGYRFKGGNPSDPNNWEPVK